MHRPETWGYVQFTTGRPGSVAFVPDASLPARRWLHEVYYAEVEYRKQHQRWAASLSELQLALPPGDARLASATLEVAGSLFDASVELRISGKKTQRWHIRQDSLIWRD